MINTDLTLILLRWRIWRATNNVNKWQMEFNLVFKGLMFIIPIYAQRVSVKINTKIIPTCFGVNTQSSGSLQLC